MCNICVLVHLCTCTLVYLRTYNVCHQRVIWVRLSQQHLQRGQQATKCYYWAPCTPWGETQQIKAYPSSYIYIWMVHWGYETQTRRFKWVSAKYNKILTHFKHTPDDISITPESLLSYSVTFQLLSVVLNYCFYPH